MMFDLRNSIFGLGSFIRWAGLTTGALLRGAGKKSDVRQNRNWWQRPGLSIMYQIETRPGWKWDRDYIEFNKSMTDEEGNFRFNGPYCKTGEWVQLGAEVGVDYHILEVKWHDGICYFKTDTTEWKTEEDYAAGFSELSRQAGIPFMFYYSSVFDHNPMFDHIQPKPRQTPSLIGNKPEYCEYIKKHYDELIEQYKPDGLWLDWYWAEGSTNETISYLRRKYPELVISFNLSNLFPASFNKIDITSGETHSYDGPLVRLRKEAAVMVPILTSAWKWSNLLRMICTQQWEVISPAGKWWQDPSLRDDPLELVRTLAVALACGGKLTIGATSQMDGSIFPDQVKQLKILGDWYKPRKEYFINAAPIRYRWFFWWLPLMGVRVNMKGFHTVASSYGNGFLLHLINPRGLKEEVTVTLQGKHWKEIKEAFLMPENKKITLKKKGSALSFKLTPHMVDPVDTIVYFKQ